MSARGERASSPASTIRRIWPPLSWSIRRVAKVGSRPTVDSASLTLARSRGENPAAEAISRSTRLRISCNRAAWKEIATAPTCSEAGLPSSRQSPVVGSVSPAMIQASVDFPDPFRPWINRPSPSCTVKVMSRSAVAAHGVPLPYSWLTSMSSSTGAASVPGVTVATGASADSTMSVLSAAPPFPFRSTVRSAASASSL
nr:hypothetical protein CPGR_02360 [Mycolicibacterium malmesburyense]